MHTRKALILISVFLMLLLICAGAIFALSRVRQPEAIRLNTYPSTEPTVVKVAPVSAVIWGDSGSGDSTQIQTADAIASYCGSAYCDYGVIAGDVIYPSGVSSVTDPQFASKFEKPYQALNFPIYIAFGNHDYLGCTSCYLEYGNQSSKWRMPASYYTESLSADLSLFVIDTENFDTAQQQWLTQALGLSSAKWKVVVGHKPILTYESTHHAETWPGQDKLAEIVCHKAQLYISGHSHALEDLGKLASCDVNLLVSGGGGGEKREMINGNPDLFSSILNGFLSIKAGTGLSFSFTDSGGKTLYTAELP